MKAITKSTQKKAQPKKAPAKKAAKKTELTTKDAVDGAIAALREGLAAHGDGFHFVLTCMNARPGVIANIGSCSESFKLKTALSYLRTLGGK